MLGLLVGPGCSLQDLATPEAPPESPRPLAPRPDPCLLRPTSFVTTGEPALDPEQARAHARAGFEAIDRLAWAEAEARFRAALTLEPDLGFAHLGLAQALAHTGGTAEERRAAWAAALVDRAQNPRAHAAFGSVLEELGDPQGALTHFRCALDLKPKDRAIRRQAVRLSLSVEGPEVAEALLRPLLADPELSDLIASAEVRAAQEAWPEVARLWTRAATTADNATFHLRAARAWTEAGDETAAQEARAAAEALVPKRKRKMRPLRKARR